MNTLFWSKIQRGGMKEHSGSFMSNMQICCMDMA